MSLFGVRQQKTLCVKGILVNKRINPGGQACVSVDSLTIVIEHKQLGIGTCCVELNVSRPELLLNGLVEAWKKLGLPQDEVSALCDIAMDGDRGIIEGLGCLKFDLPKTIANGDDVCQIRIARK